MKFLKKIAVVVFVLFILAFIFNEKENTTKVKDNYNSSNFEIKGNRILALDITESSNPDNYGDHVALVKTFGTEHIGLTLIWDTHEVDKGKYNSEILDIASYYYPTVDMKIDLTIAPIETVTTRFPKDLQGKSINDPLVVERFKKFIDFVFEKSSYEISSINIGSEFNILFGDNSIKWKEYIDFYSQVYDYIKLKMPDIPVTTEATYEAYTNPNQLKFMKILEKKMDIIGLSYYPMRNNGKVKEPEIVHKDFQYISSLFGNKKIWYYQYGYPSSEYLNSSEEKQSEFIIETFHAWDEHKDKVQLIDFTWLHDSGDAKSTGARYGSTDKLFTEFLGTLGLRSFDEKDKKALHTLKQEALKRNWK